MKKQIAATLSMIVLLLFLILPTILIGDTVLLNVTENKDNKVDKKTMFISKSYLLGLSSKDMATDNYVVPIEKKEDTSKNVLLNPNPPSTKSTSVEKKVKRDKVVKQSKIKSEKLNGKKIQNTKKVVTKKRAIRKTTNRKHSYTQDDLNVLTRIIHGEASGQSWNFQVAVGSVVLNRVKSKKFPNTIRGVVFQKGQYAATWDGNYNKTPSEQSKRVAKYLLENGSQLPSYVIFQAEFKQGKGVYKKMGNTYFCY
jgi:spore germination cell wall hydrolase CwlJ-like protein